MYSALWSPRLRQGDILGPTFLPTIGKKFKSLVPGTSLTGTTAGQQHRQVLIDGAYHHLAVVSHCCEFNEDKRNKLLVARLQTRPGNLSSEQEEALRQSNSVSSRVEAGLPLAGVDSFFLDPIPGHLDQPQVVVFTSITPVPMSMVADLLEAKIAELEQASRVLFREKLAWFFGRQADDIADGEKSEPPEPPSA